MSNVLVGPDRRYLACPAYAFRAEFGVCRGEGISRFEDLNLGDIYQLKQPVDWFPVAARDEDAVDFRFRRAANLPENQLVGLARLIFMTTNGRRSDVLAGISDGEMYLVCDQELIAGQEYVLIDIELLDIDFIPALQPAPVAPMLPPHQGNATNVHRIRRHG